MSLNKILYLNMILSWTSLNLGCLKLNMGFLSFFGLFLCWFWPTLYFYIHSHFSSFTAIFSFFIANLRFLHRDSSFNYIFCFLDIFSFNIIFSFLIPMWSLCNPYAESYWMMPRQYKSKLDHLIFSFKKCDGCRR